MEVELDKKEVGVLVKLIQRELEEINPEIHHSATSAMRNELREDRNTLRHLLGRLHIESTARSAGISAP